MPRDDEFTLRGGFAERLILPGSRESVYTFLANPETLLPLVAGVQRIVAHKDESYRLVFVPVGTAGLTFVLELELRVTGDGNGTVTMRSVPTDVPPLTPNSTLGDFTAVLTLTGSGESTAVSGDAHLAVTNTIPPIFRRMPRALLERTSGLAVNKQMETIGRDLMRNIAVAYPTWKAKHT